MLGFKKELGKSDSTDDNIAFLILKMIYSNVGYLYMLGICIRGNWMMVR